MANWGQILGNSGRALGDTTLGALGMGDVINENSYAGGNASKWDTGANIAGKTAAVAANFIPVTAPFAAGVQAIGGQVNNAVVNQQEQATQPPQPYYNVASTQIPQQNYNQSYANGGYVRGHLMGYADGGVVGSGLNPYIAGGSLALGALQAIQGMRGLNKLSQEQRPSYSVSPQLQQAYQQAQQQAQRGFSPQEEAAFKSNLAQNQNTAYQNAIAQSGGNLAQAINAGLQSQNIGALNQFSAQDADLKRQNQQYANQFANQFQNIQDENTKNDLQYRLLREQALGQATQSGLENLAGVGNLLGAYGYEAYKKNKANSKMLDDSYKNTLSEIKFNPNMDTETSFDTNLG